MMSWSKSSSLETISEIEKPTEALFVIGLGSCLRTLILISAKPLVKVAVSPGR